MNYNEAFDKYAATYRADSEGKCWFISGVGRDQLTGDGGTLDFDVHPVDEHGEPDCSVHHYTERWSMSENCAPAVNP